MAGLIPQAFIDELVSRADIVEVIGRRIALRKAGREFKACCPFHSEKTPSFTVSPAKGFYHCFGCGAHGTAIGFLMDFDHLSFVEAVETLAAALGLEVPRDDTGHPVKRHDALFELTANVAHRWQRQLSAHTAALEYLQGRGIDGVTAQRFGLGYAPDGWSALLERHGTDPAAIERLLAAGLIIRKDNGHHYDRFRDRLMFPIRDARGRTIGFGGRTLGNGEPKYLNSPETVLFRKGHELYGLYEARQALRHIERLVVVEGYLDVVALARHGIEFAVATLGTATTPEHLNRLFRLTDNVDFCFDGDRAGKQAAWRALETTLPLIQEGRQVRFVFLPQRHDPDSFVNAHGANAFIAALDAGSRLADYVIAELAAQVDTDSADGVARLGELARPLIGRMPAGFHREVLVKQLADAVDLPVEKLERLLRADRGTQRSRRRPASAGRRRPAASGGPSMIRRTIALLLNYPAAGANLDPQRLATLERPGASLLIRLLEAVRSEPGITTAGLVERFRHDDEGRHLGKLAAAELPLEEDFDADAELEECIARLSQTANEDRIDFLIQKQRDDSLDDERIAELRRLLKGRKSVARHPA